MQHVKMAGTIVSLARVSLVGVSLILLGFFSSVGPGHALPFVAWRCVNCEMDPLAPERQAIPGPGVSGGYSTSQLKQ
jgi:hypothetical protein